MNDVDSEPLTTEPSALPEISHRSLLMKMAGVVIIGAILGFAFFSVRVGVGILAGGVLAFANYFWQKRDLKAIFDRAMDGERSRFLALRYILRYVLIAGVLGLIWLSDAISIFGVIFGLASFSIAVVIVGFMNIFSSSDRQES